jgi:DNA-binding transcriptional ArsR family regulator
MPRAATTSDGFNAIAEPRRREILVLLAGRERPVGEIVTALGVDQPSVSKHLRVLSEVGLVSSRREGRSMFLQNQCRRYPAAARVDEDLRTTLDAPAEPRQGTRGGQNP